MTFTIAEYGRSRPASQLDPSDQAVLRVLEHDWRRMSGFGDAPTYSQFQPGELDAALPHAFVLHRVAPGVARIRVAGQRLHDLMRMDPRGMPFAAFFTDDSRDTAMSVLDHAFEGPAIVGLSLSASRGLGRKPVRAEALLLPMRDAQGDLTRMMGAIVTSGPLPARSLRFDIANGQPLRCDPLQVRRKERRAFRGKVPSAGVVPPMPHVAASAKTHHDTSEALQSTGPAVVSGGARPNLRLVVDNTA